jgi:hypothetical protein
MKKWVKELNRAFSKEYVQIANKTKQKHTQEEMVNIPGHKRIANQYCFKIQPPS